jgi:hypothetical protein
MQVQYSSWIAAIEWVSWFNRQCLFGSFGYIPPAEAKENHFLQLTASEALA